MKIVHIINSLNHGGAEKNLYNICKTDFKNQHIVISLTGGGYYENLLKNLGIEVYNINLKKNFFLFFKIIKIVYNLNPVVIQSWMYIADLVASLTILFTFKKNIVWNIRHSDLNPNIEKKHTILTAKILSKLSHFLPYKIIVCAQRALDEHKKIGYNQNKMNYIPNGCDLKIFYPQKYSKQKLCNEFNLNSRYSLLGSVGRYHPYKDLPNLIKALNIIKSKGILFNFLLVGHKNDKKNSELINMIKSFDLDDRILLMGSRTDIPYIMNCLDLYIQSSSSEAFPNVLIEAMACGTPCVATDVGDTKNIIGDTGWIVKPENPEFLAMGIEKAIIETTKLNWDKICLNTQKRISEKFSLESMINSYSKIWEELKNKN